MKLSFKPLLIYALILAAVAGTAYGVLWFLKRSDISLPGFTHTARLGYRL